MVMANTFGMMGQCMKENGMRTKLMDVEFMFGLMVVNTTGSGRIIICMVKEFIHGKMEECMKETMKMTESMVMVSTLGTMANNTKVGGKMANSMERVSTEKMVGIEEEYGKMEREQNG
jgi:hypothetical protein